MEFGRNGLSLPLGYKEERGQIKVGNRWKAQCCVVAEGWPSWSIALHALGVGDITTVLPSATQQAVHEINETVVGSSLMEFEEWATSLNGQVVTHDMVFIQGLDNFVDSVCGKLDRVEELTVFGIVLEDGDTRQAGSLTEKSWPSANSVCVNHEQAG